MAEEETTLGVVLQRTQAELDTRLDEAAEDSTLTESTRLKAERAYALRLQGVSIQEIAKFFSVSNQTVYRWVSLVVKDHREALQGQTASEVVAESLLFYDHLEKMYLNEVSVIEASDSRTINPVTGEVVSNTIDPRRIDSRTRCLKGAMDARKEKIALLASVGLLPKDTTQLYKDWKGRVEQTDEVVETSDKQRSADDIKENVMRLLQNCRTLS